MPGILKPFDLRDDPDNVIKASRNISRLASEQASKLTEEKMALDANAGNPFPLSFRIPEGSKLTTTDMTPTIAVYDSKAYTIESNLDKLGFITGQLVVPEPEAKSELLRKLSDEYARLASERESLASRIDLYEQMKQSEGLNSQEDDELQVMSIALDLTNDLMKQTMDEVTELSSNLNSGSKIVKPLKQSEITQRSLYNTFNLINIQMVDLINYFMVNLRKEYNTNQISDYDKEQIREATADLFAKFNYTFSFDNVLPNGISLIDTLQRFTGPRTGNRFENDTYLNLFNELKKQMNKLSLEVFKGNPNTLTANFVPMIKGGGRSSKNPFTFIHHPRQREFDGNPRRYEF
jgi:hypothetical protein